MYWGRFPEHLSETGEMMAASKLTPASLFVLGESADETAPAALIFTMPPNSVVPRHSHICERFEVILEGSLKVDDLLLGPGDVMVARKGDAYGPHTAGPEGCQTLEIFSTLAGADHIMYETADGPMSVEFWTLANLAKSQASSMS